MQRSLQATLIVSAGLAGALLPFSARMGGGTGVALACSCNPQPAPSVARDASAVVFLGGVAATSSAGGTAKVTFDVEKVFKGELSSRVVVETNFSEAACGFNGVPIGSRWLVYSRVATPLGMYACSRTRRVEQAADDLAALGAGHAPTAASSSSSSAAPTSSASAAPSPPVPSSTPAAAPRKTGSGVCAHVPMQGADECAPFAAIAVLLLMRARGRRRPSPSRAGPPEAPPPRGRLPRGTLRRWALGARASRPSARAPRAWRRWHWRHWSA